MHTSQSVEEMVFHSLCSKIDSSFSREMSALLRERNPIFLTRNLDLSLYSSPHDVSQDYLVAKFLSKWKGLKRLFSNDTKQSAIDGWTAAEQRCAETNSRLGALRRQSHDWDGRIYLIMDIRAKIREILGEFRLDTVLELCEWTTGATATLKRRNALLAKKMSEKLSVTPKAVRYIRRVLMEDLHWSKEYLPDAEGPYSPLDFNIIEWNRFITVPKTAKTDRCIAAEPSANSFLQKGVGNYIRNRLRRHGIRLDKQEVNQWAASVAHCEGFATLDLEMASDTLSVETVRSLLPEDWYNYLSDLRCSQTMFIDFQEAKPLNKFSSMGNGFTFELETLIFYAIARCVSDRKLGLNKSLALSYGDDIIVDQRVASDTIDALEFFGFMINRSKSFTNGEFFESCGKHYFRGVEVTPLYQKEEVRDNLHERIRLYNRLYRWGYRQGGLYASAVGPSIRLLQKWFSITKEGVKSGRIPAVPECISGDDGYLVHTNWLSRYNSNSGYSCRVYVFRQSIRRTRGPSFLLAYKFRQPAFANVDPKGRCSEVVSGKGAWVFKTRWIQPWALPEDDLEPYDSQLEQQSKIEVEEIRSYIDGCRYNVRRRISYHIFKELLHA